MKMRASHILICPEPWTTRKLGSIHLPDSEKDKFARGTVQEVGPGLWLHNGDRPPIEVDKGDHVLYFKASAADIVVGGVNMHIVDERQIIAILEPGDFDNEGTN